MHQVLGVLVVLTGRHFLPLRPLDHVRGAEDDGGALEGELPLLAVAGQDGRPRPGGQHDGAGLAGVLVHVLDPGAFREQEELAAALQVLHGGLDGAYVTVASVDPEDARTAQEPAQNGHLHQLLFGHDPEGTALGHGEADHQRVQIGEVVGADEDFALGDIFRVNFSEREQEHEQRFHEAVEVAIALVHTLVGVLLFLLVCHGSNPLPDGLQEQLVALLQICSIDPAFHYFLIHRL